MSGDSNGSPWRDDHQRSPHFPPAPDADDVRVAGPPPGFGGDAARAGDTAALAPVATLPRPEQPRDELGAPAPRRAGRRAPRSGRRTGLAVAAVVGGAALAVGGGSVAALAFTGDDAPDHGTVKSAPVADAAVPEIDTTALAAERRKKALARAGREAGDLRAPTLRVKGSPIPSKTPTPSGGNGGGGGAGADPVPAGEAQQIAKAMLPSYGFGGDGQFACLVKLWNKESGWRTTAANPSGAYGIPQALPGSKMASAGSDWRTSARTQIKWGLGYIKSRHGTPCGAWNHSEQNGWY
ncbi:lytic transglycosylase domain-containing protein [Actinomadura rayongensis]|uniref:aggregation-promoting factor C-terminal-like domain-containing protein n=1 Tax=Actinomadura rayongensis TaxID=1429076 RepID=UPI001F3FCF54|nr:lytic transglycosylase domain-containing protein [Actinomadura rayongensis]